MQQMKRRDKFDDIDEASSGSELERMKKFTSVFDAFVRQILEVKEKLIKFNNFQ